MPAVQPVKEDGRHRRRSSNREAVVDALVALFSEGCYEPSAAEIAERAGLSPRSLFRYFDDVDDLHHAAIDRQLATARPLVEPGVGVDAPLAVRVERIAAARVRLFDAVTPGARAARVCLHRRPVVAAQVREARAFLRRQLERLFAGELAGSRAALLPAVDALCSFESYDLMRDQGLTSEQVAAALRAALSVLLSPPG